MWLRRWWPRLAFAALFAYALYALLLKENGLVRVWQLQTERARLQSQVEQLRADSTRLQETIERLEARDPELIELKARDKEMIREGEEVWRIEYQEESQDEGDRRH
jgi:cell division protein FtsB